MKKVLSVILAICMISMLCLSASAGAYYEYDNRMSSIGMRMTSALYLYSNNNGGIDVTGITRVETGYSPAYTSFTMYSRVHYSYFVPVNEPESSDYDLEWQTVNNVSPNTGYYIPEHGLTFSRSEGAWSHGYHEGWAIYGNTVILEIDTTHNVVD